MAIENLITDHLDLWSAAVRPKSSAGRGSSSKLELTGIKKLRELILELAVRGKLVPQDPSDEPASVLLERIAAEKARLVKEKKIKKEKPLPAISEDEKPFELPKGWEWCRFEDIVDIQSGITKGRKLTNRVLTTVPYLSVANVQRGYVDVTGIRSVELPVDEVEKYQVLTGDLLITEGGDWDKVGRTAIWADEMPYVAHQNHVFKARKFLQEQDVSWLEMFLNGPSARDYFAGSSKQTTNLASINKTQLRGCLIAIPPKNEKSCIVAKVDELMTLCDQLELRSESQLAAHQTLVETLLATLTDSCDADELAQNWARLSTHFDTLFTTEASIDALKQTILQLAVMGKLVPQDPSDEPASALLEHIAAEKARLVKEKKIKKEKPLPVISENEKPFELPQGWEWCHLKDIITIMDAGWSPACPPESSPDIDTWGVLKTTAVQTLEYREYENKVLDKTKTPRPEYEVMVGDILITRAGPKNRVGISCLVEKTRPKLMISDKIIRFHLVEVGLSERFISLCLNAGATAVYIDDSKSGMAESQMNISQDKLKLAPIPLGPIKEQNHIMDRVDQLMTLCDQLKSRLQTNQQTQLALAESLVEGALA
ncbi:restriction endonuclease subunit S [Aeromonas caviae]|uniref:restriction endonuclease subunit S n=1 Tax=Aeromonas caviae TaxID=648 RepID=UPI001BD31F10|nr:restriction endonuclease subunit S [Aeromonas caviae]MBS4709454.1 restriction endonuclease subunit S [Aeromonas caviae]